MQLKSYALDYTTKEDRYYSLYFDGEQFVVLGNDVHGTTLALIVCEYFGTLGSLITIYTLLLLTKLDAFRSIRVIFSEVSVPCVAAMLFIVIKDIVSYCQAVDKTSEWSYAFPIPFVFPICSIINIVLSIATVVIINKEFPLPGLLNSVHVHCCCENMIAKGVLQIILVFSLISTAILFGFHFVWVILAFSAYPIRSIASQAFIIPVIFILTTVYFVIDAVIGYGAPHLLKKLRNKNFLSRFVLYILMGILALPFTIGLFGVLYFYSQVLVEVNESENNPFKTVIAGLTPTAIAALAAWSGRKILKTYAVVKGDKNSNQSIGSSVEEKAPKNTNVVFKKRGDDCEAIIGNKTD